MRVNNGTSWKKRTTKDTGTDKRETKRSEGECDKDEEDNEWINLISNNISNVFGESKYSRFVRTKAS